MRDLHQRRQVARSVRDDLRGFARFVAGLSATVARKDGHHPIVFMQCGPVRHRVEARAQAAARPFEHRVLVRPTAFRSLEPPEADKRLEFRALYQALVDDDARTRRICEDIADCVRAGRSPLVLTERSAHLDRLEQALAPHVRHVVVMRAGMGRKQREAAGARLAAIPHNEPRVVLATGRHVGEGFDDPRLDTLFLTLPVSWRGTIAQYAGRLHRLHDGKREVRIYDYADLDAPMLARMFDRRCRGYEAIGYTILLPASAIPGWPVDVVLPADPAWKRDYSGSVRRLVRDGVDAPLANLFVYATRTPHAEAEGADRARSATEAFLFRRLETLAETKGRFRLNERLPIAFDASGALETDLLCADARVAIELDGAQHPGDTHPHRRGAAGERLPRPALSGRGHRPGSRRRARRHPAGARPMARGGAARSWSTEFERDAVRLRGFGRWLTVHLSDFDRIGWRASDTGCRRIRLSMKPAGSSGTTGWRRQRSYRPSCPGRSGPASRRILYHACSSPSSRPISAGRAGGSGRVW